MCLALVKGSRASRAILFALLLKIEEQNNNLHTQFINEVT